MTESLMDLASWIARRTLREFISDDTRAAGLTQAAVQIQKAHQVVVQAQEEFLHELGFAALSDYQALARQAAQLKRRARRLRDDLERRSRCLSIKKMQ